MATFTKAHLSGAADGEGILVAATSGLGGGSPNGTLIHTAVAGTTAGTFDEVWLYATNTSTAGVKLTIEWGNQTDDTGHIEVTIPPESGLTQVVPGLILHNTKKITAFAGTTNVITVHGFVNSIA
jgi:hypothetical protein|tara:strand:+ start:267 stop:641 length:375 start_codon:yes stop_codon:yes gene_type:complete